MTISFTLPGDIERNLRNTFPDLDQTAKESALVELYRQEKLTHHELAQALGLSRFETDAVLKRHNVTEDLITFEEFKRQSEALEKLVDG